MGTCRRACAQVYKCMCTSVGAGALVGEDVHKGRSLCTSVGACAQV